MIIFSIFKDFWSSYYSVLYSSVANDVDGAESVKENKHVDEPF